MDECDLAESFLNYDNRYQVDIKIYNFYAQCDKFKMKSYIQIRVNL